MQESLFKKNTILLNLFERNYYLPIESSNFDFYDYIFIFLHGLEENGKISAFTLREFHKISHILTNRSILPVFPVGVTDCFEKGLDHLAWTPILRKENIFFLRKISTDLSRKYKSKKIFLFGFSNGAYLVSEILQSKESNLFDGYWIQGGGNVSEKIKLRIKPKVILEIGKYDKWNYFSLKSLKDHLINSGWNLNKDIIYRETNKCHILDFSYLEENLKFFLE